MDFKLLESLKQVPILGPAAGGLRAAAKVITEMVREKLRRKRQEELGMPSTEHRMENKPELGNDGIARYPNGQR
jgi:hypothetical protein